MTTGLDHTGKPRSGYTPNKARDGRREWIDERGMEEEM
jgi:hypothetical protein